MSKIIVAGSINMDVVVQADQHPHPGETVFGKDVHFIPGGKGSNQAVAAHRLGGDVVLVGKLGQDSFGSDLHRFLQGENLNLSHLHFTDDAPSGTALITVNAASENTIVVVSGSNFALRPADMNDVQIEAGDIVVSVFEIPQETIRALFSKAKQAGATTILNPAPAARLIDGLNELCDCVIVNETELAFFAGSEAIPQDHERIKRLAEGFRSRDNQTIVVTLGAKGAAYLHHDSFGTVAGRHVEAVDTTGAGDCFVGALAAGLAEGNGLADAIHVANTAASLSVQKLGASDSLPYRAQVMAILSSGQTNPE